MSGALLSLLLLILHHEKEDYFQVMSQHLRQQLCDIDDWCNFAFKFLATSKFRVFFSLVKYRLKITYSHDYLLSFFCPWFGAFLLHSPTLEVNS